MDSIRWDALRIAGMENGWLVDPDEVQIQATTLPTLFPNQSIVLETPFEYVEGHGLVVRLY